MEKKVGKSWKREREERGRRQLAQKDRTTESNENTEDRRSEEIDMTDSSNVEKSQVIESSGKIDLLQFFISFTRTYVYIHNSVVE